MSEAQSTFSGKLFNLKEWLTIPEAARHLSAIFDEEVSEADILRLALARHLRLSVYFVNHAYARGGLKLLTFEEWEKQFRSDFAARIFEHPAPSFFNSDNEQSFYIPKTDSVVTFS